MESKERLRIVERVFALRHGNLADLFQRSAVLLHMEPFNQGHQRVRAAVTVDVDVVAALVFELPLLGITAVERITSHEHDHINMAALNRVCRAPHAHDASGAAVVRVQHPIDFEPKLLRDVRRIVRTRLCRDGKTLNVGFAKTRLL